MRKISLILAYVLLFSCRKPKISEESIVEQVYEFKKGRYEIITTDYYFYTNYHYKVGDTLAINSEKNKE